MKHFEHLWEEAEKTFLAKYPGVTTKQIVAELRNLVYSWEGSTDEEISHSMGTAIFQLCGISALVNINTYAALQEKVTKES